MSAILSPLGGRILDHYGARQPILWGATLMLIGLSLFSIFALRIKTWQLVGCYFIMMIGMGLCASNIMTCALNSLSSEQSADGNAVLNTFQ